MSQGNKNYVDKLKQELGETRRRLERVLAFAEPCMRLYMAERMGIGASQEDLKRRLEAANDLQPGDIAGVKQALGASHPPDAGEFRHEGGDSQC